MNEAVRSGSKLESKKFIYRTYVLSDSTLFELQSLIAQGVGLNAVIFVVEDSTSALPFSTLMSFVKFSDRLLEADGNVLFLQGDTALLIDKDDIGERNQMTLLDSPQHLFILNPQLAQAVCSSVAGFERLRIAGSAGLLAHILHSSICVTTDSGKLKRQQLLEQPTISDEESVFGLIDDFSSIGAIAKLAEKTYGIGSDSFMRAIQALETDGFIYPIFCRLEFLSRCYHSKKSFRMGSYLLAARILTEPQLQDLLTTQSDWYEAGKRPLLGQLAVESGYLSKRQLEVLLFDQFVYGRRSSTETANQNFISNSIVGSLATMSAGGLIQSLASDAKTGLLTVENSSQMLFVVFAAGKVMQAQLGRLKGRDAFLQFVANWTVGIFVFRDDVQEADLAPLCNINSSVEKLLMDAALSEDQNNQILSVFNNGLDSIVENTNGDRNAFQKSKVRFIDESFATEIEKSECLLLLDYIDSADGFSSIKKLLEKHDMWTTNRVLKYLHALAQAELISAQHGSVMTFTLTLLRIFDMVSLTINPQDNVRMLNESLEHSDAQNKLIFSIDDSGRMSFHWRYIKENSLSMASIKKHFDDFLAKYLSLCSAAMEPAQFDALLADSEIRNIALVSALES